MRTKIKYQVGDESLQRTLISSMKAELSYDLLISKTKNTDVIHWISEKKECTTDFILKVLTMLEDMEIQAKLNKGLRFKFNHLWFDLKTFVLPLENEDAVRECLMIDNHYLDELENELKSVIMTDHIYALYTAQREKLRSFTMPINGADFLMI